MKKVYIAGPLCNEKERKEVEEIAGFCEEKGLETFLPHKDAGLWKNGVDFKEIAEKDLKGFENCDLVIANLNGFNVGAGTAWEMGYAHAKGIPVIGLKTDRKIKESVEEISAIILGITKIVSSTEELQEKLKEIVGKG
jgi:nucleoside 2-deoxyribosyltransferase